MPAQCFKPRSRDSLCRRQSRGLLNDKKATVVTASGGRYDTGAALETFNFIEPYLRAVFAFLGVTQTAFGVS
ncbi:MAG TPA: NAD(P)H-dependent oxidoreductase [Terracidiphilus sp.]|nr:NAD(P)H-dependent oxidoreductase [Terracidiphilus sp.]